MSGTVCLAVYRPRVDLLRTQIDSIRSQTLTSWDCIVGIDGADAHTRAAIEGMVAGDERFRIVEYESNVGFYRNFERLLEEVLPSSEWVALADQDDAWYPEKLALLVPLLDNADLAFGQALVVDAGEARVPEKATSRRSTSLAAAFIDNQVTGSISVFRRALLDTALPLPDATDSAFHDHWLGVCALAGQGIAVLPDVVQDYIQHGENVIGEEQGRRVADRLSALSGRSGGGVGQNLDYISAHRWRWRVNMATALLERAPGAADSEFLRSVAADRLSFGLISRFVPEIIGGRVPPLRALALLAGSWRSPRLRRARK
ncbi:MULTISPECIES: glycosyltransferase [unclassified Microbacterium]|uniref:glycosyltransferase n=1 Tax=unclassified Microbacterium TaxID=2609290 RepID=UPI000CFC1F13|nr:MULTISPECIES: glycosyltransferase [unclassified Microbacterium]PQZ59104.1 hypothetical protein CQ032_05905 [Microbacterium sp. MYb43]PQZ81196.1 hypothetical protein CQ031_05515 [Microbacterium sp. MYb40]PRB21799.1 hypothetical protein CQ040_07685 [Microbacterium sp. MYb54]PRB31558.1 hypothetical protein CQ037_02505 [Microbacterium sp. MYb50]PRB68436.1 hypothetical protein CQ021_06690 [Microbacterium sp. MYb24]